MSLRKDRNEIAHEYSFNQMINLKLNIENFRYKSDTSLEVGIKNFIVRIETNE
jgi:hypothetical protein